ncbi:E3 ubiquitin-protein ligase Os03g0188200-like [Triticum aestivum]|nr:E3 ubiquitin-protein ligase Os03g0188200-like [Triticum aestivum]
MAPSPPSTTCLHCHRPFFRLLVLVLAGIRPASSQFIFTPPTAGATFVWASTPPPPPPPVAGGLGSGTFNIATSILFVGVIVALFLVGFFSAYLRRCADAATGARRGGAAANANAAVAAAAAAAFSSAVSRSRRRPGLDVAAMEALPVLTYARARAVKAGRGALECAVCLAEFADDGEKLRLLPGCCHVFHAACIDVWLAAHVTCPVCRADLADPAVAAAGHVLAADLAAQVETSNDTVINVETPDPAPVEDAASDQQQAETAEERVDRFTLRLPERLRREIEEAKRLRRAMSAVTAAAAASTSSERWVPSALRTMSAARPSGRWSALFRALSGPHRSELGGSSRRVAPLQTRAASDDAVEVVVVQDDAGQAEKYYAHSLTFAGFVIDGDVAAGDWNPEVFQISSAVPVAATSIAAVKPREHI